MHYLRIAAGIAHIFGF